MSSRDEARGILKEFYVCRAASFFNKVDEIQRGVAFCLFYLRDAKEEVIAGDLAREMKVSTARVAALLKGMEKHNLVTRTASPCDARKTVVKITSFGKEYLEEQEEQLLSRVEQIIEKVGLEEVKEFIRISRKIKSSLE